MRVIELTQEQQRSLEQKLGDHIFRQGVANTGLEVYWVHQFDDGEYRVHFCYENNKNKNKECRDDFYGRFHIRHNCIEDLEESK
jgi:hypothetical protein